MYCSILVKEVHSVPFFWLDSCSNGMRMSTNEGSDPAPIEVNVNTPIRRTGARTRETGAVKNIAKLGRDF